MGAFSSSKSNRMPSINCKLVSGILNSIEFSEFHSNIYRQNNCDFRSRSLFALDRISQNCASKEKNNQTW